MDNQNYKINMSSISKKAVEAAHGDSMMKGGQWRPCDCKTKSKMALIIPFRNRHPHLYILLNNLIPLLQYQKRDFRIYVIDQVNCSQVNSRVFMNLRSIS